VPNIDSVLAGMRAMAAAFVPFLLTSAVVAVGLVLIFLALRKMYMLTDMGGARGANGQEPGWGAIAGQLLIGGLMLRLGGTVQDMSNLLFGGDIQDISGVMAYAPLPAQAGFWSQVLQVCLLWVVMLGWAGAFRGLLLWNQGVSGGHSGGNGDYYWRGFWHLIGGAAAVNLTGMIKSFLG
jgi:hypothetical protein